MCHSTCNSGTFLVLVVSLYIHNSCVISGLMVDMSTCGDVMCVVAPQHLAGSAGTLNLRHQGEMEMLKG